MRTFSTRALSALVAVIFVSALVYWGGLDGMRFLAFLSVLIGIFEGGRLLFGERFPKDMVFLFQSSVLALFVHGVLQPHLFPYTMLVIFIFFVSAGLLRQKSFSDLDALIAFFNRSFLGFFYLLLLPLSAVRILDLPHGLTWFLAMMAFVFAGDTMAYLVGSKFGRRRMIPAISPKKSYEGSLGGLLGSCLAALLLQPFLSHVPLFWMIVLALVTGFSGQMGDFFESLLKRVANQKDSGALMPGHGGVLDRIDGVLFAAPVILAGATLLENWF